MNGESGAIQDDNTCPSALISVSAKRTAYLEQHKQYLVVSGKEEKVI